MDEVRQVKDLDRIEKLFRLLGSDNEPEAHTALRMIKKLLHGQNQNFSGLANHLFGGHARHSQREECQERHDNRQQRHSQHQQEEQPDKRYDATEAVNGVNYIQMAVALHKVTILSDWEKNFINDIYTKRLQFGQSISRKQRDCLVRIFYTYLNQKETA